MTACTQPGCTGTIVDGYCDVCGSRAGAVPFVLAEVAASASSPVHARGPELTAVVRGAGFPPEPKNEGLNTACTQPGCTGSIVDGYCDVCGSPAVVVPFVSAEPAASTASAARSNELGLTAVGLGSGVSPEPKSEDLDAACTQPGCTGSIVDGYCDVCGSPAVVVPTVPAEAAASTASSGPADEPGRTAVPALTLASASVDEEIPTQRLPRVKIPRQQLSTQERADPGAADPGAVDAKKVDGEKVDPAADDTGQVVGHKELAEDELDGAQNYRTRVEEAQLPDDVREAALREVGKLERTSDQSPESGNIRTWLDTILDLPWSTETTDWIDIEASREVEATLRRLIEPAAADLEEGDTGEVEAVAADLEEVEAVAADLEEGGTGEVEAVAADLEEVDTVEVGPAAADLEEADTAPAGPQYDDTVMMTAVPAVHSGGRYQRTQLPEQPVLGPEPVQTPRKKRRSGYLALAATALVALLIGVLVFAASRDRGATAQSVPTVTTSATATVTKPTSEPSDEATHPGGQESTIQLEDLPDRARPFETVRIQGTYPDEGDTFLRVQRLEGGKWLDFPLPTKTDPSGQFTAFIELGQPGRYRLRVLDPDSGVASKPFVLVIMG
jgi:hypothetical protein